MRFAYYQSGAGYCLVRVIGNARNQRNRVRQYVPAPYIYFKADLGSRKAQRRLIMKKLFATCLLLLNILPAFAYVRDDRDSGTSGISLIIVLVLFIIGVIKVCKGDGK